MMLENGYYVAGIVGGAVAVIGLFLKFRHRTTSSNNQNAKVSGNNNSVSQAASVSRESPEEK